MLTLADLKLLTNAVEVLVRHLYQDFLPFLMPACHLPDFKHLARDHRHPQHHSYFIYNIIRLINLWRNNYENCYDVKIVNWLTLHPALCFCHNLISQESAALLYTHIPHLGSLLSERSGEENSMEMEECLIPPPPIFHTAKHDLDINFSLLKNFVANLSH